MARYELSVAHNPTTAPRLAVFPISSASACRLIFMEAVRGKSFSQIRYPPTRLKSGNLPVSRQHLFQQFAVEVSGSAPVAVP